MPKSLDEIIARSDALAAWIEQWNAKSGVDIQVHEHLSMQTVRHRMQVERKMVEAVARAREERSTWGTSARSSAPRRRRPAA